ncbi:MAG: helix-turn-helix domain-containing protein [Erythrobacter sp.]
MDDIKGLATAKAKELRDRQNTIKIIGADPMSSRGFTQVPNFILENEKLSVGAKMTYAMMLRYAWANDHCFPGQKTLAKDAGMGARSVVRYIKELEDTGFITIKRRGLGKVNIYELRMRVKKDR